MGRAAIRGQGGQGQEMTERKKRKERPRCNGPGNKIIMTREEAKATMRARLVGRRAGPKNGHAHPCTWAFGAHWHISSGNDKKGNRRK